MMPPRLTAFLAAALVTAAGLALLAQSGPASGRSSPPFAPVSDEMLWKRDAADWLSWRRTPDGWGFSPLDQITRGNVSSTLRVTPDIRPAAAGQVFVSALP